MLSALFPDGETSVCAFYGDNSLPTRDVATRVLEDLGKAPRIASEEELAELLFQHGDFSGLDLAIEEVFAELLAEIDTEFQEMYGDDTWEDHDDWADARSAAINEVGQKQNAVFAVDAKYRDIYGEKAYSSDHIEWVAELRPLEMAARAAEKARDRAVARAAVKKIWPAWEGTEIVKITYADEEGEDVLEHGNIFKNVPHITCSNH
jgi:hypothetical protein